MPPTPRQSKWERETGVSNFWISKVYMTVYRFRPGALSPERLARSEEQMQIFKQLLGNRYAHVSAISLAHQLENLRKSARWNLNLRGPNCSRSGYRERVVEAAKTLLDRHVVKDGTVLMLPHEYQTFLTDLRKSIRGSHGGDAILNGSDD